MRGRLGVLLFFLFALLLAAHCTLLKRALLNGARRNQETSMVMTKSSKENNVEASDEKGGRLGRLESRTLMDVTNNTVPRPNYRCTFEWDPEPWNEATFLNVRLTLFMDTHGHPLDGIDWRKGRATVAIDGIVERASVTISAILTGFLERGGRTWEMFLGFASGGIFGDTQRCIIKFPKGS